MDNKLIELIVETRFLVGFLGEKEQANWWGSSFLSKSSSAFLTPVFPKTTPTAQYHGICQAAKRVHDEHIGLGRNYHLYRLPDSIERSLANAMNDQDLSLKILDNLTDRDLAIKRLAVIGRAGNDFAEGPIAVGDFSDDELGASVKKMIPHYRFAFENDMKCYPYLRDLA